MCSRCPRLPLKKSVSVYPVHGNPRTDLLRTFWERDRVLRSLLQGLRVQGAQNSLSIESEAAQSPSKKRVGCLCVNSQYLNCETTNASLFRGKVPKRTIKYNKGKIGTTDESKLGKPPV